MVHEAPSSKEVLKRVLREIKDKGYVVSLRKGDTGVGYTLEALLLIEENNKQLPDFGGIEIKCRRVGSQNRVTLFTLDRNAWKVPQKEAITTYGYEDARKRLALKCTVSNTPNRQGLYLKGEDSGLALNHVGGKTLAVWSSDSISKVANMKLGELVLVSADVRVEGNREEFYYKEAVYLSHFDVNRFISMVCEGTVVTDLRMHLKAGGGVRNHGTAFRVAEKHMEELFLTKERLL